MVKFSVPSIALAIGAGMSSTAAFAPAAPVSVRSRPTALCMSSSSSSSTTTTTSPLAPLTIWGDKIPNIIESQKELKSRNNMEFAPVIKTSDIGLSPGDTDAQLAYVEEHAMEIKQMMVDSGAVIFREFDLMKEQAGFVKFYEALGMRTCLDPLHSVSARPTVDGNKNSPVYEAVNKESRKNFFIGMHNEFVGTRAPRAAAFVCFKAAETGGSS